MVRCLRAENFPPVLSCLADALFGPRLCSVLGIANPPLLTSDSEGSTLLPSASILTSVPRQLDHFLINPYPGFSHVHRLYTWAGR
jgi:hypothetical protein